MGKQETEGKSKQKMKIKPLPFIALQAGLFVYSLGGVCSKMAGKQDFLSPKFFLYFGLLFTILLSYAVIWQQVLRHVPLTMAYACKSVAGFYSLLWGALIFGEKIRPNMIIGLLLVLAGVSFFLREEVQEAEAANGQIVQKAETANGQIVREAETEKEQIAQDAETGKEQKEHETDPAKKQAEYVAAEVTETAEEGDAHE